MLIDFSSRIKSHYRRRKAMLYSTFFPHPHTIFILIRNCNCTFSLFFTHSLAHTHAATTFRVQNERKIFFFLPCSAVCLACSHTRIRIIVVVDDSNHCIIIPCQPTYTIVHSFILKVKFHPYRLQQLLNLAEEKFLPLSHAIIDCNADFF